MKQGDPTRPYPYGVYPRGAAPLPPPRAYYPPRARPPPAYYPRPPRQPLRVLLLVLLFAGLLLTSSALIVLFIYRPPGITHTPVTKGLANSPVSLNATLVGGGSWLQNATVYYNVVDKAVWKTKEMQLPPTGVQPYVAVIPGNEVTSSIVYYIQAVNSLGLSTNTVAYFVLVKDFRVTAHHLVDDPFVLSAGTSNNTKVEVKSLGGFSSSVSLSMSGLPSGVSASFNPPAVTPPANGTVTSVLTVSSTSSAPPGTYTVTLSGSSGNLTHTQTVTVKVNPQRDFELSASPGSIEIRRGAAAFYNVTLTSRYGYSGDITLTVSGLPTGIKYTFTTSQNKTSLAGTVQRLKLVVTTNLLSPLGTFNLTVSASDGVLTHTANITLRVRP